MDKHMVTLNIKHSFQMLTLILSESQRHKCVNLIKEHGVRSGMVLIGRGTVNHTALNLLGIKSKKREILMTLLTNEKAEELLDCLDRELQLHIPGNGIAFTSPVLSEVGLPCQEETVKKESPENTVQHTEVESVFKKLSVIVDRGMSEDVMDIARKAGVRGGTILHGRGAGAEIATRLFGVEIEPEKELVIILTPSGLIDKVMNSLVDGLHLDEPGKGILFVEPIIETRGLLELNDKNH
jgi:nitrogen regulatory protein PII